LSVAFQNCLNPSHKWDKYMWGHPRFHKLRLSSITTTKKCNVGINMEMHVRNLGYNMEKMHLIASGK
jgi:hypothetical protein